MEHIVPVDEIKLHSRKDVRIEAGEGSSGHDQPDINMDLEERFINLMEEGDQMRAVEALGTNRPPAKIQKVTFLLRDHKHFVKYFEPTIASYGPIHHGNPKYQLGEKFKFRLAYEFVQGCGKSVDLLYKVAKEIKQLRECFEEEVTKEYDDKALAWMLFMDGCAILQYILCAANYNKFEELNIKNDSVAFAQQDLFLLENQVPYCLLNLLMRSSRKEDELRKSIESFIQNVTSQQMKPIENRELTHLLDLQRTTLLGPPRSMKDTSSRKKLSCPWRKIRPENDLDWQSYRNGQELKSAGIQLKRSKNRSLRNVSFTRIFNFYPGYLWLPPITVDDSTGPKFMNLIAYEMCLDFENDFSITSYISFLDSLIDEANDVKDLRKAHVLHHFLGSDQEVANLFNAIGTNLVPSAEAYKDVKLQIQGYDNNWMTWMAQFFHDHFSAPCSITSLVYSIIIILGLTAIQTWYTVYPPRGRDP